MGCRAPGKLLLTKDKHTPEMIPNEILHYLMLHLATITAGKLRRKPNPKDLGACRRQEGQETTVHHA